jgi:V/A-type H+-transporting ATPase subunit I
MPGIVMWAGIALIIVSVPLVFYGGGIFGTIELISAMGNIMSYARLMAIGMASVVLAIVANQFAGAIGIAVVGIAAAISLHLLNLAMGMFSPSIHALRLHMVELFPFYEAAASSTSLQEAGKRILITPAALAPPRPCAHGGRRGQPLR